jgi:hypothetical protein
MLDNDSHCRATYIFALIVVAIVVAPVSIVIVIIIFVAKSQIRVRGYMKPKASLLRSYQVT